MITPALRPVIASAIRPIWLRPAVIAAVVGVHAAVFAARFGEAVTPGSGPIEIAVVSEPEPSPEPTPEVLPSDASRAEAPPPEPEPPPPEVSEETPPIAVPTPVAEQALPEPRAEAPRERPKKVVERKKEKPKPRREAEEPTRIASIDASAQAAARASEAEARRAAAASYASLVAAEIARHKHYPASARESGVAGSVGVAFTVGGGGTIVSHSIVRSSGHGELDAAVHGMMAAVRLPPPPGGVYRSSISVRFDLR